MRKSCATCGHRVHDEYHHAQDSVDEKRLLVMTVGKYMLHFMHDWGHRVHDGCVAVPIKAIAYHFYILQSSISHTFTKLSTHTLIVLILNIIFTIFFV